MVAVTDHGNFSSAALGSGAIPIDISHAIATLKREELGVVLLFRGRQATLTDGRAIQEARQVLQVVGTTRKSQQSEEITEWASSSCSVRSIVTNILPKNHRPVSW